MVTCASARRSHPFKTPVNTGHTVGGMSKQSIPILRLADRATFAWLVDAFGFLPSEVSPADGDELQHGQLNWGEAILMASTGGKVDQQPGQASVYLTVDTDAEVDAAYERAVAAGATSVLRPEDQPYGGRNATVRDPEGNWWSVGSYQPTPS